MSNKLHKSHSNFTLKRLHQAGGYGNIYERDHTTINSMDRLISGQIPLYGSPTFKVIVRSGINSQKKYNYGKWLTEEGWTIDTLPKIDFKTNKVEIKSDKTKISDFACYGSAFELIRQSITHIVSDFPGEMYFTDNEIELKGKGNQIIKGFLIENPFEIDIINQNKPQIGLINEIRYFATSFEKYDVIEPLNGVKTKINQWDIISANFDCFQNGEIIAETEINGIKITAYFYEGHIIYLYFDKNYANYRIRPNDEYINQFFDSLNEFEQVILNPKTKYTCEFETIEENEEGFSTSLKTYRWPTTRGWNLNINGIAYDEYADSLSKLATISDKLYCDVIWRCMVHDSIKNLDKTYDVAEDGENIDYTNKIETMIKIFGRQMDDVKKYADSIKRTNNLSYDENGNVPDYFLPSLLNTEGWETIRLFETTSSETVTPSLYPSTITGYDPNEVSNEFFRRLKINSKYINSSKGTKASIEALLAMFGLHSTDYFRKIGECDTLNAYIIEEYVTVAKDYNKNYNINDIKEVNRLKDSYIDSDEESDYIDTNPFMKIPVATMMDETGTEYLIPWFDKTQEYDGDLYFQSKGGWPEITVSQIYFSERFEDLLSLNANNISTNLFYYVKDEDTYYKIIDEKKYNLKESWKSKNDFTVDEAKELEENLLIVDNNKGNNPHSGLYDGGNEYVKAYNNIFRNSSFENNVINNAQKDIINNAGFKTEKIVNTKKCHYFGVTNGIPKDTQKIDLRINNMLPHNLITKQDGVYDEISATSIINDKQFKIYFNIKNKEFIEKYVLFYLKQIIPSTTIFSYEYVNIENCNGEYIENAVIDNSVTDNNSVKIYDII